MPHFQKGRGWQKNGHVAFRGHCCRALSQQSSQFSRVISPFLLKTLNKLGECSTVGLHPYLYFVFLCGERGSYKLSRLALNPLCSPGKF